ncbi:MerR family transcriptional regulator [Gynuella sp.]|uniref:MerR family transcriptional regulator n=1 Tax=Gynuella sp. TaxID=2969146 RepID=UPI003D0BBA60
MRISQLQKQFGLSANTIRYYESQKMLSPVPRSESGYRVYQQKHVAELQFIIRCKELGIPQSTVKQMIDTLQRQQPLCQEKRTLFEQQVANIEDKIANLVFIRDELHELLQLCDGRHDEHTCSLTSALLAGQ